MAVTATQTPNIEFDQAYGANPVTLSGIPTDPVTGVITADKYVLRIYRIGSNLIADIRQTPNQSGKAIFDIQNVLQNFVAPSTPDIEQVGYIGDTLRNAASESTPYTMSYGYEVNGVVTIEGYSNVFTAFGGTKNYYEVPYNPAPYIPILSTGSGGVSIVVNQAQPFTDLQSYRLGADITDGKPFWLTPTQRVYDHYVTRNDMTTISYFNGNGGTGPALAQGIDGFTFYQYDGNTLLSIDTTYNLTSDGGGPNVYPGQGLAITYPNNAITLATGPKNFQDFVGATETHYYVISSAYTTASIFVQGLTDQSLHYVHRFNIVEEDCNDYPHYQFSWLNSYGFRDYYTFKKRKDRKISISRNTYLKEAADYSSDSYNVNIYDRGNTAYSQTIPQEFTAFTDFISDADALYLEGLFKSADVKVRFNDAPGAQQFQWVPVALISNSYTEKTTRKDQLFQYDIKFKIAHNIKSQRG